MTPYTLNLITPPAVEPISLALAQMHMRVDDQTDAAYISGLITAARVYAEHYTRRAFITQTWDMKIDQFHYFDTRELIIPKAPLQSVTYIQYVDTAQNTQTLGASSYVVDSAQKPARIYPAFAQYWPATLPLQNSVTVRFVAGYGATQTDLNIAGSVPGTIIQGMLLLISHWYENREPVVAERGVVPTEIPLAVDALLGSETVIEFA